MALVHALTFRDYFPQKPLAPTSAREPTLMLAVVSGRREQTLGPARPKIYPDFRLVLSVLHSEPGEWRIVGRPTTRGLQQPAQLSAISLTQILHDERVENDSGCAGGPGAQPRRKPF